MKPWQRAVNPGDFLRPDPLWNQTERDGQQLPVPVQVRHVRPAPSQSGLIFAVATKNGTVRELDADWFQDPSPTALQHGTERLSRRFAHALGEALSATGVSIAEVVKRNHQEGETGVCHSHDFLDANGVMAAAFQTITGREPEADSDEDNALWNAAWNLARRSDFFYPEGDLAAAGGSDRGASAAPRRQSA